jgi:hypothetical protein
MYKEKNKYKKTYMELNQIYIFISMKDGFPKIFNVAVEQEVQAKHVIKDCQKGEVKITSSLLKIQEKENQREKNGLFVLLEDRLMNGKFYPTGDVFQNNEDTEKWVSENPVGVERKFEEVSITKPHQALKKIFENS